jgi:hypothetical protein
MELVLVVDPALDLPGAQRLEDRRHAVQEVIDQAGNTPGDATERQTVVVPAQARLRGGNKPPLAVPGYTSWTFLGAGTFGWFIPGGSKLMKLLGTVVPYSQ